MEGQALQVAAAGYVALAVDLFRGKLPRTAEERAEIARTTQEGQRERDVQAAVHFLRRHSSIRPDLIGVMGWCMGGTYAFRLAVADPALRVAVIRYGNVFGDPKEVNNPITVKKINARVLGIFGGKDERIPLTNVRRFEDQMKGFGKAVQIVVYPEAGHAFEVPGSSAGYRADDTADAWKRTIAFLRMNLAQR